MDLDKQEICIRSDIIKRFINRSVEKERYLFLAMCSNQDADRVLANSHFLRTAGPHFPDSPGHIKRTAWDISRAEGTPPH